jgi:hypothetical protein
MVGIKCGDEWVWKTDTGSESNIEKEKGHSSDAFKRACVHWGIGRFLYDMDIKYVTANEKKTNSNYPHVIDKQGNRVWDLTKHINSIAGNSQEPPTPDPEKKKTKLTIGDENIDWLVDFCKEHGIEGKAKIEMQEYYGFDVNSTPKAEFDKIRKLIEKEYKEQ